MHPGFVVYNPETCLKLRAAVGDIIGANFDPSHLFWQGINPVEAIKELKGAIYHFHAKDRGVELFIALGVGGTPSDHEELFLIPGRMVKLDKKIDRARFIKCICGKSSEDYHKYIAHYYQKRIFKSV